MRSVPPQTLLEDDPSSGSGSKETLTANYESAPFDNASISPPTYAEPAPYDTRGGKKKKKRQKPAPDKFRES